MRRRFARRAAIFGIGFLLVFAVVVAVLVSTLTTHFGDRPGGGPFGIVVVIVGGFLAWRAIRAFRTAVSPLGELIEASARVEAGQLGTQVAVRGPREVRALAGAFNDMSARLAAMDEQRRRLLADVSHELRTPLTVIQGNVEAMLDGVYPPDRTHLERILRETHQLERLIEDLRTLSLAESGSLGLQREPTDLAIVAAEVVAGFEAQATAAGVTLALESGAGLPELELDPRRIRQVLTNLVSNALRHTPEGGRVTVSTAAEGGGIRPRRHRHGPGDGRGDRRAGVRPVLAIGRFARRRARLADRPRSRAGPRRDGGAAVRAGGRDDGALPVRPVVRRCGLALTGSLTTP